MGRRRIEARARNVRTKTTEGVGCEGRGLRETGNARFPDANVLHLVRMVDLYVRWRQLKRRCCFEGFLNDGLAAGAAEAGFAISWRIGWLHAIALLRAYSQQKRTITAKEVGQRGFACEQAWLLR